MASIKPLQLIAAAVTQNEATVQLLIEPGQSHHDYHLRPSDRQRLQDADLVFWVGPALESYLRKTLTSLPEAITVITLAPELAVDSHIDDSHAAHDGHIWLDPTRAVAIANTMAAALARRFPDRTERWHTNAAVFAEQMQQLDSEIKTRLQAMPQQRRYLAMHDAYGHFERHFGLQRAGTYAETPERQPGARHLAGLLNALQSGTIDCVLTEPQARAPALERVLNEVPAVRVVELDLMAVATPVAADAFGRYYAAFANDLLGCLEP